MCPPKDIPEDQEQNHKYPCECGGEIYQNESGEWVCDKGGHKCTAAPLAVKGQ